MEATGMGTTTSSMEEFWGAALSKNQNLVEWEVEDDDEDSLYTEKTLEIRQACLGSGAKEGERNVVEMTTENDEGTSVTHAILSMRLGGVEQCSLFLTLRPPVSFKLAEGSGPIHLVGQVTESIDLDMLNNEDEDEDDEEEEEKIKNLAVKLQSSNKRPAPANSTAKAPSAKVAKVDEVDGEEDDSDEEDEDFEEEDEDEDMSDEEEEDEDEDDESEQENVPPPKKSNSKSKTVTPHSKPKQNSFKTPQPPTSKAQKGSSKGARSLPNTPKVASTQSAKKKTPGTGKGAPDLNEIKERLTKMSVPKKLEKFNNFVSNSFKIKDPSITKQLWEYVQKNRPEK